MKPTMTLEERILTLEEKVVRLQFDIYAMRNKIAFKEECDECPHAKCLYAADRKTEPQTDCYVSDLCKHYGDKQICGRCRSRNLFCEAEPQTERSSE